MKYFKKKVIWKYFIYIYFIIISSFTNAQQHPKLVNEVLNKAGKNRNELEKAIDYCIKTEDSLKLKAMYFLISNMDIHYTSDYYWENKEKEKIIYNELNYSDFDKAITEFDSIKKMNPGLKPKVIIRKDIETITGDYLINNLEKAFLAWKTSPIKNVKFDDFCEYILPYRISIEPLQDWRSSYFEKYNWIIEKLVCMGLM
ncbi:MAG: hypothetical protein HC854_16400 [Flavobacterium sp.]|nr:hypothetical protein [Flavobacterium sp.]